MDHTAHCIIRNNYEIIDFHAHCLDDQGNLDDLVDIVAGGTHFVALSSEYLISLMILSIFFQRKKDKNLFYYKYFNKPLFFVDSGQLYCYGFFGSLKAKRQSKTVRRISENFVVRIAKCGRSFVVFVTGN